MKFVDKIKSGIKRVVTRQEKEQNKIYSEEKPDVESYTFVFVCQAGKIELQSLILAASMKQFIHCQHEIVAAVPMPVEHMGTIDPRTEDIFKNMGIRIFRFENTIVNSEHKSKLHYMSNKIFSFRVPITTDKLVFVDSDSIFCNPFYGDKRFSIPLNVRIVGLRGAMNSLGRWKQLYSLSGVKMPRIRIKVMESYTSESDVVYIPPYFNSGFIAINSALSSRLADYWLEIYSNFIDSNIVVDNENNYFVEQCSLAIAVQKLDVPYEIISEPDIDSMVFHYYIAPNIERWNKKSLALSVINQYPQIKNLLREDKDWNFLF